MGEWGGGGEGSKEGIDGGIVKGGVDLTGWKEEKAISRLRPARVHRYCADVKMRVMPMSQYSKESKRGHERGSTSLRSNVGRQIFKISKATLTTQL